jgi:hypothetical protein
MRPFGRTFFRMPALVKGSVFFPIPFKVTVGTRHSLHVLISESKVE